MLQILALWLLTERIGSIIEQKGHKTGRYKVLTVALWFGGEIIGAILGVILTSISKSAQCVIYPFALGGAAVGAGVAYLIAATLSPTSSASLSAPPSTNSTFLPIPSDLHFYENARWRLVSNILWNGLILAILMIVVLVGSISSTWFWSPANVQNITRAWLTAALLVPTMALVIASGGLDLSVGSVAGLTSVVMASLLVSARVSIGGAFIVGLCLAFLVGLVNGLLIGMIKLNAAVVTLAMMTMLRGICYTITRDPVQSVNVGFLSSLIIPGFVLILLIIVCVVATELRLVGNKRRLKPDNKTSWIRQSLLMGWPYVLSSTMAGFVGALYLGWLQSAPPSIGTGLEVDVILIVFLGGTPFGSGFVNIMGAVLASLMVTIAQNIFNLTGISSFSVMIWKGEALLFWGLQCHAYYYIVNRIFIKTKVVAISKETK